MNYPWMAHVRHTSHNSRPHIDPWIHWWSSLGRASCPLSVKKLTRGCTLVTRSVSTELPSLCPVLEDTSGRLPFGTCPTPQSVPVWLPVTRPTPFRDGSCDPGLRFRSSPWTRLQVFSSLPPVSGPVRPRGLEHDCWSPQVHPRCPRTPKGLTGSTSPPHLRHSSPGGRRSNPGA